MSAVLNTDSLSLRPMRYADLQSVITIERQAYGYPWTEGIFRDCLRVGYSCWVMQGTLQNDILAYAVMSMAVEECHLLNICVRDDMRRQGLGRRLLRELLSVARRHQVETVFLEVRPSNERALNLYLSEGFNEIGIRKDYYPAERGREDAVILAKPLLRPTWTD